MNDIRPDSRASKLFQDVIKISLFCFLFFSTFSISAAQISLGLGFLGWMGYLLFTPPEKKQKIILTPVSLAYVLFLFTGFLSVLFAEEKLIALNSFRSFWIFFAFLLSVNWIKNEKDLKLCLIILIVATSIISLMGLIQYLGGLKIFGHQLTMHKKQVTGPFHGSMTFAGLIMVSSLVSIPVFFPRSLNPRSLAGTIALGLMLFALLFSQQRGVWLGFTIGIIFTGLLKGKKALIPIILSLALGAGIIYKLNFDLWERGNNIFKVDTSPGSSSGNRFLLWEAAWEIAKSHPLTGTGVGQFKYYASQVIMPKISPPPPPEPVTLCHAHSNPLQILATMGVLGVFAYIFLWVIVFREGFRILRRVPPSQSLFVIGVLSALIGFHIEGFFEYNFGDSEIITLVWFLVGGMMAVNRFGQTSSPTDQQTR